MTNALRTKQTLIAAPAGLGVAFALLLLGGVCASTATAQTIRPMAVDFATPKLGVTAPLLGGAKNYTLKLVKVGQTVEREPIWGFQICDPGVSCKRAVGIDQSLGYSYYMQAVQLVDHADRPTVVGYNGYAMLFCHATNYVTATQQGFTCSQTQYQTTAKPIAVRGYAHGQNSYNVVFGAPSLPAGATFNNLPTLADEINRNEAFMYQIKDLATAAAVAAGVPMTRVGPLCTPLDVDSQSALHDAHALRVVTQCKGGGNAPGEDPPGQREPIEEPPIEIPRVDITAPPEPPVELPPVQVTCSRESIQCWPIPAVQVLCGNS